jgi:soluble lytic murein transglycosylase-like protein
MKSAIRAFLLGYLILMAVGLFALVNGAAIAADASAPYRATLIREAQAVYGPDAPAPMFAGQIQQESSWRPNVTAFDNGRGLAQFMDGTTKQITALFPELGPPDPYDPRWAIRAMVRYDGWIYRRIAGGDACQKWAAVLKGYNAGPGYVLQAQAKSPNPAVWFGITEYVQTRQSPANFEYSRMYPRKILFVHQPKFAAMGTTLCLKSKVAM